MSNDIFLAYANKDMKESPENLFKIIDVVTKELQIPIELSKEIYDAGKLVVEFSRFKSSDEAESWSKTLKISPLIKASALSYVFGYDGGYCYGVCPMTKNNRPKILKNESFEGNNRLKCFECDQQYFKYVLSSIIDGKDFSEIDDFTSLLFFRSGVNNKKVVIIKEVPSKESKLLEIVDWNFVLKGLNFPFFLQGITTSYLVDFLINENREKLKKCQLCNTFFISNKADQRVKFCPLCSPKSKMGKEDRKKYQKKYRDKKRKEKKALQREMKIKNFMDKLGCTREEAEDIIKADSNM